MCVPGPQRLPGAREAVRLTVEAGVECEVKEPILLRYCSTLERDKHDYVVTCNCIYIYLETKLITTQQRCVGVVGGS